MAKPPNSASVHRTQLRQRLWPEFNEEVLWLRTKNTGFTTIPRTMPLIGRILDSLSGKGVPLASTYLTLWCWVFDEGIVEIRHPAIFAYESGFSGPRGESVWKTRMRRLQDLSFIRAKKGIAGEFHYVLLLNPMLVIAEHFRESTDKNNIAYNALLSRLNQVGDYDLDQPIKKLVTAA